MKVSKVLTLLIGSALVLSSGAFAGDANKGKLHLHDKTIVDGKSLSPGDYTVEWTGTGPTVQVRDQTCQPHQSSKRGTADYKARDGL